MKKSMIMLAVAAILVIGASCSNNTNTNVNTNSNTATTNNKIVTDDMVVIRYMKYTLGSIPDADIDYEKAKQYLTDDLATQFINPMFVTTSYCIQDGPDDARIASNKLRGSTIEIIVEGQYGGKWQKMWQFLLVPDKHNMSWLISKITCLNE